MAQPAATTLLTLLLAVPVKGFKLRDSSVVANFSADVEGRDPPNAIFFAGVEGSGHHFLEALMALVDHRSSDLPGWGCSKPWERSQYGANVAKFRSMQHSQVYVLPQQYSYPMCCVGDPKSHEMRMHQCHPKLDWMAEAAHEAGVNLQVLFLHRNLEDCLAADCLHRRFEACQQQTETLVSNVAILTAQLRRLKPEQLTCFRYGSDKNMVSSVKEMFGDLVPRTLVEDVWRDSPPKHMRDGVPGWASMAAALKNSQKIMDDVCNAATPMTMSQIFQFAHSRSMVLSP